MTGCVASSTPFDATAGGSALQVLQEFYVAAIRKVNLAPEPALQTNPLGRWRVHRPSVQDVPGAASFLDGMSAIRFKRDTQLFGS